MQRILFGLFLLAAFGTANATQGHGHNNGPKKPEFEEFCRDCLSFDYDKAVVFKGNYDGQPEAITGDRFGGLAGALYATGTVKITATFLGAESSFVDSFKLGSDYLYETGTPGVTSISKIFHAGDLISFSFSDDKGYTISNGQENEKYLGFAFLRGNKDYQFLLGFNDSSKSDADFDDFVVGINYVCNPPAVPEPDTYAMLLAGLGLMGFTASRRRKQ